METAMIAISFRFERKGRTDEQIQSLINDEAEAIENAFGSDPNGLGAELSTEVDMVSGNVTGSDTEADVGQILGVYNLRG